MPMYQASSFASAGEASEVEASASATASFRILIPFLCCHYGQRKLPTGSLVSTQGNKIRELLHERHSRPNGSTVHSHPFEEDGKHHPPSLTTVTLLPEFTIAATRIHA